MADRYDYEYFDMGDGGEDGSRSIPIDEFRKELEKLIATAEDKDGYDLRIKVDSDRDILVEYERPETPGERRLRLEREERNRQYDEERRQARLADKRDMLESLAKELGAEVKYADD